MGTTPNFQIPYPEPTDPISRGAEAMKNLATRVDQVIGEAAQAYMHAILRGMRYDQNNQISQLECIPQRSKGITYTGPGRFRISTAGIYLVSAVVSAAPFSGNMTIVGDIAGGTRFFTGEVVPVNPNTSQCTLTAAIPCSAGNEISLWAWLSNNAAVDVWGSPWCHIVISKLF